MQTSLASALFLSTALLLAACKKDDPAPVDPGNGGGTPALSSTTVPFVQMTIDGNVITYAEGATFGSFTDHYEDIATPPDSSNKLYGFVMFRYPELDSTIFVANLGTFNYLGAALPTNSQFFSFFPLGPVTYGDVENNKDLVAITWFDPSGQEWSTFWGADQTGSSFNITERLEIPTTGTSSILVRATFTCKLYLDGGSGQFKQVSNGSGVFRYLNF